MDKDKGKRLNEIFFNELGGMDNFQKAWKIIAKKYEKVKTDTEQDFTPTLESMKAYLQAQGLILPKNFEQFWHWFVIKYSDQIDKTGVTIEITQEMINDFSRERTDELKQGLQPTTPGTSPQAELETTEQKIKRILEPLRGAFDSPEHIDIIINAFIKLKAGENLQKVNKAILYNMELKEFIKPFGSLFAEEMFKRGEITKTLLFYIEKNTVAGEPEYSEGYINRLLSECRSK